MIALTSILSRGNLRARKLVREATAAMQRGEFNEAVQLCTLAIELRPTWAVAYAHRAHAWICLRNYERAIDDCTTALSHDPRCAAAYNNRSVAYSALNRRQDALADIERAVRLAPLESLYLANCGIEHKKAGNIAAAIDDLLKALRLNSANVPARIELADAYASLGKDDLAWQQLQRAIQLQGTNAAAYKIRGDIYARSGKHAAAVSEYSAALRYGISAPVGLFMRAQPLHALGHAAATIRDLTESIQLAPTFLAYLCRANAWAGLGSTAKSAGDAREALRLLGDDATNYGQRGLAYLRAGDLDRASADFERMIESEPENGLHYNNRGYIRHQRGDFDLAIADYETAIRLSNQPNAYKNLATLRANCAARTYRDGAKAITLAQRALELTGGQKQEWLCVLANAYAEAGDFAAAESWLQKAAEPPPPLEIEPSPPPIRSGSFQFSLAEIWLVLTVLGIILALRRLFPSFADFVEIVPFEDLTIVVGSLFLLYFGGRACIREIRRREPGHRAYCLGLVFGALLGILEGLSWYAPLVQRLKMRGLEWGIVIYSAASTSAVLAFIFGFFGGATAIIVDRAAKRLGRGTMSTDRTGTCKRR